MEKQEGLIKELSQNDVFRFINNRAGKTPNYAMLLGAGCSVTSGIDSAVQLVRRWKREIYSESNYSVDMETVSDIDIDEYLKTNDLYPNDENEYSYYFNKRYPIEKQKYIFIENEIDEGSVRPFIGYACTVGLAKAGYFDTFFTTNFDDLLNEAFYMYDSDNKRPIVCYHDSNASYVSLNSNRVRIVKLHGDYMYGEMKITGEQTQALSKNLATIFGEFAKARGLIVMGYAGNDPSIMNALKELLKDDNNYKNGIIWCVRKGESIPNSLIEIVQEIECKNVYFVQIDGFDEFLMELHKILLEDRDPVLCASNDTKEKLLENGYWSKAGLSEFLQTEHEKICRDVRMKKLVSGENSSLDKKNKYITEIGERIKKYKSIVSSMDAHEYEVALEDVENRLVGDMPLEDRLDLLRFKAQCLYYMHEYVEAKAVLAEVIHGNKYYSSDYVNASLCVDEPEGKISILDQGISVLPSEARFYARKGESLIDIEDNNLIVRDGRTDKPNPEIIAVLETGIKKSLTVNNDCWSVLYDYLLEYSRKNGDYSGCEKLSNYFYEMVPYSNKVIQSVVNLMEFRDGKPFKEICHFVDDNKLQDPNRAFAYDKIKLGVAMRKRNYDYLKEFCLHDYPDGNRDDILLAKCGVIVNIFRRPDIGIHCMEAFLEKHYSELVADKLADLYCSYGKIQELRNIISEYDFDESEYEKEILEVSGNYEELLVYFENEINSYPDNIDNIIGYSHTLLCLEKGKEAYEYLSGIFNRIQNHSGIIAINYYLAKQMMGKKINNEKNINGMATEYSEDSDLTNAAAWYMKKNQPVDEGNRILIRNIENDFTELEHIRECYVFRKYLPDDIMQELILSKLCKVPITSEEIDEIEKSIMKLI